MAARLGIDTVVMALLCWRDDIVTVDSSLGLKLLPSVLGVIAGSTDAIGFLGLGGLFTAHVTGNLVILVEKRTHAVGTFTVASGWFLPQLA